MSKHGSHLGRAGVLIVGAVLAVVMAGCTTGGPALVAAKSPITLQAPPRVDPAVVAPPNTTLVATLRGDVPGSPAPGAAPTQTVPGSWYGYTSILPVVASAPNWIEVRLAQRPNQSTAWIPQHDASLSVTPYDMVLDLATMHLSVYEYGKEILDFPAGIGTPDDPTVTGHYFIAMRVPPPDPGYGAFVLATSAHSDSIEDWEGSGDAVIGIHGPITSYDDQLIGTTGAAISHGCIRLHDADLAQLSIIPDGTPLDIVAG
ncbi:MAG: L,D-transpeptidase [Acidimicrobiales bacterium]